jgi:hypothetical protein
VHDVVMLIVFNESLSFLKKKKKKCIYIYIF